MLRTCCARCLTPIPPIPSHLKFFGVWTAATGSSSTWKLRPEHANSRGADAANAANAASWPVKRIPATLLQPLRPSGSAMRGGLNSLHAVTLSLHLARLYNDGRPDAIKCHDLSIFDGVSACAGSVTADVACRIRTASRLHFLLFVAFTKGPHWLRFLSQPSGQKLRTRRGERRLNRPAAHEFNLRRGVLQNGTLHHA